VPDNDCISANFVAQVKLINYKDELINNPLEFSRTTINLIPS